jgi:putative cardiolipin synthase
MKKMKFATAMVVFATSLLLTGQSHATQLHLLVTNEDAMQARIDLIQQAKSEIRVEYFITGDTEDYLTTFGLALLRQAAQQGKKVRIMVDAQNSKITLGMMKALQETSNGNLEFRLFDVPNLLSFSSMSKRDHSKELNIDGEKMIVGDRNASCEYFGLCDNSKSHFVSIDTLVKGPEAKSGALVFDDMWDHSEFLSKPNFQNYRPENLQRACSRSRGHGEADLSCAIEEKARKDVALVDKQLNSVLSELLQMNPNIKLNSGNQWFDENSIDYKNVHFLYDNPVKAVSKDNCQVSKQVSETILLKAKPGAQLTLLTPYFIPTKEVYSLFEQLKQRGVKVKVITNSLVSTDNYAAQAGYLKHKMDLIGKGIEIYEFKGKNLIQPELALTTHAKCAILNNGVDPVTGIVDATAFIGTYNLDARSQQINREIGIVVADSAHPEYALELEKNISIFQNASLLVGKDGQPTDDVSQLEDSVGGFKKTITEIILGIIQIPGVGDKIESLF